MGPGLEAYGNVYAPVRIGHAGEISRTPHSGALVEA
jgi:hypothetical protein